jgi:hypothetical protein
MSAEIVPPYETLGQKYVELWNGADEAERRAIIQELWANGGGHTSPNIAARGYEELEARVARSQQRWIAEEGCRFRMRSVDGHHNVVRLIWEMIDGTGNVESIGTEVLVFDRAGKIADAYQFIDR